MVTAVIIALLICSIALHELGHALLMKRYGVPIQEICLLGIGPRIFTFHWKHMFGDTPITIRLFPIAAFVRPKYPHAIEELHYIEREHIYSGGVAMNLLFAGVLFFATFCFGAFHGLFSPVLAGTFLITAVCGGILWLFPRIAGTCVLVFGSLSLGGLLYMIVALSPLETVAGPIGVGTYIGGVHSYIAAILFSAIISVNLGIFNMMPLGMLDGGLVAMSFLTRKFPAFMKRFGRVLDVFLLMGLLAIIALAFGSDIARLFPHS